MSGVSQPQGEETPKKPKKPKKHCKSIIHTSAQPSPTDLTFSICRVAAAQVEEGAESANECLRSCASGASR
jgi:hypothetical protein